MPMSTETKNQTPPVHSVAKIFSILSLLALLVSLAGNAYLYNQLTVIKNNPSKVGQSELVDVVARVQKILDLPEGEQPTLATVSDPSLLKGQQFFAKAKTGDKVLLYATARKAILFDPIANRVIEVSPINIGNNGGTPTAQAAGTVSAGEAQNKP